MTTSKTSPALPPGAAAAVLLLAALAGHARDYTQVLDRNPWLAPVSGAALTTFADSSVTRAGVETPPLRIDVASVYRLSPRTVVAGSIAYSYDTDHDHTGTAFSFTSGADPNNIGLEGLAGWGIAPFDLVISTPGRLRAERVSLAGAFGWQVTDRLSAGAAAEYTTASIARQKDLRYSNSLMDLAASAGLCYTAGRAGDAPWATGVGVSAYYRRSTQSLAFSRAGTTDIVHTTLIDYGCGLGVSETFSGEGFTDDTAQPLFSEYTGVSVQVGLPLAGQVALYADALYARRTGYYGKQSQYTIVHTRHHSDCWRVHARLSLPGAGRILGYTYIDARIGIENLENNRTNYLSQTVDGVTSYIYHAPTKTANKLRADGHLALVAGLAPGAPGGGLRLTLGSYFSRDRQTSWLYPATATVDHTRWTPFAAVRYPVPLRAGAVLSPQVAVTADGVYWGLVAGF